MGEHSRKNWSEHQESLGISAASNDEGDHRQADGAVAKSRGCESDGGSIPSGIPSALTITTPEQRRRVEALRLVDSEEGGLRLEDYALLAEANGDFREDLYNRLLELEPEDVVAVFARLTEFELAMRALTQEQP